MPAEDPSVWKYLLDHVWVPLGAAIAALWAMLNGRISETRQEIHSMKTEVDSMYKYGITKEDFKAHVDSDDKVQMQIREEIEAQKSINVKIFDQMREMETKGHERHVELLTAIHSIRNNTTPRR